MKERDALESALAEAHRREDPAVRMSDPAWEKLAARTLTAQEAQELKARVAGDPELAAARALLADLAEDRASRAAAIVERIEPRAAPRRRVATAGGIALGLALAAGVAL